VVGVDLDDVRAQCLGQFPLPAARFAAEFRELLESAAVIAPSS
jgi:hypothetical protein